MKNYNTTGLRGMIEQMSTEQLDEMLLHELEKESVDESAVRLIMEVLEKCPAPLANAALSVP